MEIVWLGPAHDGPRLSPVYVPMYVFSWIHGGIKVRPATWGGVMRGEKACQQMLYRGVTLRLWFGALCMRGQLPHCTKGTTTRTREACTMFVAGAHVCVGCGRPCGRRTPPGREQGRGHGHAGHRRRAPAQRRHGRHDAWPALWCAALGLDMGGLVSISMQAWQAHMFATLSSDFCPLFLCHTSVPSHLGVMQ